MNEVSTLAETGGFDVTSLITTVTEPIKSVITVDNLGKIIAAGLVIAVPFVVGWFAYRFVYNKAKGGLKKGK